ncbi:MAG: cysteine desulfurase [Bacteroidota bacterium]
MQALSSTEKNIELNIESIRNEFPILTQKVNGKSLVYLDNGATSQKPKQVIESLVNYYSTYNSNIHRGVHSLSQKATDAYEQARNTIQKYINANNSCEVIFTKGATEGINLVAQSFTQHNLKIGDEVLITAMEHHANIVPWQMVCEKTGAKLVVAPINKNGELIFDELKKLLNKNTKIVSVAHVSNALGTINPIKEIITLAHQCGAKVLVDGCQAVQHMAVDVQDLNCDFYCFSGHKIFGPTGIGVLYGKEVELNNLPPYQGGGDMIKTVTFEKTTYNELPFKFEAGTPPIAEAIGLGAAINYINEIGINAIEKYEHQLLNYATKKISEIENVKIIGEAKNKAAVLSFVVKGIHPYDIGMILDKQGVAVRTGHHCAQPVMDFYEIPGTVRASFAFYNTFAEIDFFIEALKKAIKMLS